MKKLIIFLFYFTQFMNLNGQSVDITCPGGGTDCFSVACTTPNNYLADISDGVRTTPNGYSRTITWTSAGSKSSAYSCGG